jgi:copper chaperone CopZ
VRAALQSVPGVRTVEVNFDAKEAYVSFDASQATLEAMVAALDGAGFNGRFKQWGRPPK